MKPDLQKEESVKETGAHQEQSPAHGDSLQAKWRLPFQVSKGLSLSHSLPELIRVWNLQKGTWPWGSFILRLVRGTRGKGPRRAVLDPSLAYRTARSLVCVLVSHHSIR